MKLDVALQVALKSVDLVANTAYLTLVEKLGYEGKLLSIIRLESYAFTVQCENAAATVTALERSLNVRTTFYNRNKHNYFLACRWDGATHRAGASQDLVDRRLVSEAAGRLKDSGAKELDSQGGGQQVILSSVPVHRCEVLVEDKEPAARTALARRLESELATAPVVVSEMGTRWIMALRVASDAEAEAVTREIVVTEKRGRGLLLNPNHQGYQLLSLGPVNLSDK